MACANGKSTVRTDQLLIRLFILMGDVDTDLLRLNTPSLHQCLDLPGELTQALVITTARTPAWTFAPRGLFRAVSSFVVNAIFHYRNICEKLIHIIYAVENPHKILKLFNTLVPECREGRAPSKRRKLNRPPSHRFNTDESPEVRNQLKQKIEQARKS